LAQQLQHLKQQQEQQAAQQQAGLEALAHRSVWACGPAMQACNLDAVSACVRAMCLSCALLQPAWW
jgi:hypothetical protein